MFKSQSVSAEEGASMLIRLFSNSRPHFLGNQNFKLCHFRVVPVSMVSVSPAIIIFYKASFEFHGLKSLSIIVLVCHACLKDYPFKDAYRMIHFILKLRHIIWASCTCIDLASPGSWFFNVLFKRYTSLAS